MVSSEGLEYVIGSSPDRPVSVIWEFSSTNRSLNSIAYFATADDADKWLQDVRIYAGALIRFDKRVWLAGILASAAATSLSFMVLLLFLSVTFPVIFK
jgi:hypothetical protein